MGETTKEEIIYSVKLDIEQTNKALKEYADSLGKANAAQAGMTDATAKSTEEAKRQEAAAKKTKEALEAEEGSIKALREENKKLTAQRNNTTLATEEGRKKVEALNKQLDENNEKIKENVDAYTKQKIGIGSYTDSIKAAIPFYREAEKATAVMTQGVGNFTKALVATGVGLFVAALGSLIAYFKGSEEGQNRLNKIMLIAGTIMEKIMDVAEALGKRLFEIATNPKQAFLDLVQVIETNVINRFKAVAVIAEGIANLNFKQVANGFLQLGTGVEDVIGKTTALAKSIGDTFNQALEQGSKLAAMAAQLDKDERALTVERAKVGLEVAKLRAEAVHQEGAEKRATIQEAITLEEQLAAKQEKLAAQRLAEAQLKLKANGDDKEALNAVAQAEADLYAAKAQRFEATLRFQKEIERLDDQEAARIAKKAEDTAKWEQDMWDKMEKDRLQREAKKEKEDAAKAKEKEKNDKLAADNKKKVDDEVTAHIDGNLNKLLGSQKINYKAGFELFKKGKLAEILTATHDAAVNAMASASTVPLIGWLLGPAAYAATYAQGIASYALVGGIAGFAKGGKGNIGLSGTRVMPHHGIPIQRANGDNRLVTMKVDEVVLNQEQQAKIGGPPTLRAAGVPGFAAGGAYPGYGSLAGQVETRIASDQSNANNMVGALDLAIRNMRPVLVLQEFEAVQSGRDDTQNRARVI